MPNLSSVITQTLGGSPIGVNLVSSPSSTASGWSATAPATVTTTTLASELPLGLSSTSAVKLTIGNAIGAVALNFEVPVSMRQSVVGINWWQLVSSSPAFVSGSSVSIALTSYTDQARTLNARTYTLPVTTLSAVNNFFNTQFTADDRQYYTLAFGMVSPNTAWISLAQVFIGQVANNQSAAISDAITFIPSGQGFGTINTASSWMQYRRVGSYMHIYGRFTAGTATGVEARLNLPFGTLAPIAGTNVTSVVGKFTRNNSTGTTVKQGTVIAVGGNSYLQFGFDDYTTASAGYTALNGNVVVSGVGDWIYFDGEIVVPISEWSGSGTVNLGAGAQVEYVYNTGAVTAANGTDTTSFGYGPAGTSVNSFASTTANATTDLTVQFQYPIQSDDVIALEVYNGSGWYDAQNIWPSIIANTSFYGAYVNVNGTNKALVSFGNQGARVAGAATYAASGQAWSAFSAYKWRVRKAKASSPVGFGLASSTASGLTPATATLGLMRYNTSNGYGSTNTTIRRFSTLVSNTGSVVYADSAAAGTTFTIGVSGVYAITYSDEFSSGASMGLSKNSSQLTTNIASITAADRLVMASVPSANITTSVSWTGYLDAGDIIRAHADTATSGVSTVRATFTIQRIT